MDVQMPDGTVVQGVPDGTTKAQLMSRYSTAAAAPAPAPAQAAGDNGVPLPEGATASWRTTPAFNNPVQDQMVNRSSIGRVLDQFGQGFKDGFGADPILSPETEAAMRAAQMDKSPLGTARRAFNEAIFRPAATMLEGTWRATAALPAAVGRAVGQAMNESGVTKLTGATEDQSLRDWEGMFSLAPVALGMANELGVIQKPAAKPGAPAVAAEAEAAPRPKVMATNEGLEPPHSVFQEPPPGGIRDSAGNINLNRINSPEDVKDVIRGAADANNDFMDARRGTMSLAQIEELADASGTTSEGLMKRKVGEAFSAEQAVRLRKDLVQSATEVRDLAAKAAGGSEQDLLTFQQAMTRHTAIQEQVAGMTAEAGRALSSFNIAVGEEGGLTKVLKSFGGRETIEDLANKIKDLDSPEKISRFLMDSRKATKGDMVMEAWINGLLSGPTTHIVNAVSNLTTALWNVPETALAATIGKLHGGERVMYGEAGQELFAIVQGSRDGVLAASKAFKDESFSGLQKTDMGQRRTAIPSKNVTWTNPLTGKVHESELGGKQVRTPGRALSASDEFFKAIGRRQAINRLAYRKAAEEGLEGEAHAARLAQLVENPTNAMRTFADEQADYQTFTNPLGEFGSALQKLQQSNKAARVVLAFIRTPLNIAKYTVLDRTPLGLFSKEVRQNLASSDPILRDTTQARMALGTSVAVTAVGLAARGLITGGGPTDPKERAVLRATGWQPYSMRVGDMYYSYARIEPFATLLGITADMYDKAGSVKDAEGADKFQAVAGLVTASLAKNMASKTSLTGLTDLVQAVEDPDRYGKQYLAKLAASTVPNVLAQTARMNDPYVREAKGFLDQFAVRIPGLSETVAPRLDIWGQPIPNDTGASDMAGIYSSRVDNDPVNQEMAAIGVFPGRPQQKIGGVRLTDQQYQEYQFTAGRLAKTQLDQMVASEGWQSMPEFARKEIMENTVHNARQTAAGLMQMRHPELIQQGIANRVAQIRGQRVAK